MQRENIKASEFSGIVQQFISYKLGMQGCSPRTADEYMFDLRTFFRFLIQREGDEPYNEETFAGIKVDSISLPQLEKVGFSDIMDYIGFLTDVRGNSSRSVARKLSALRSLYKYLTTKMHYFEDNPMQDVETPKIKKSLPKVLTLDESLDLLGAAERADDRGNKERDYCMITLFLNCGMRVSELAGINVSDFDIDYTSLRVLGKGNKERVLYLNPACQKAVTDYLEVRKQKYKNLKEPALFISQQKRRMSVKTVQWTVYKYLENAGLSMKHYSVHKLRHTAATLMYQTGKVDIRVLQEVLGHEQLNTTQIYTHVANADVRRAMSLNPLANTVIEDEDP